jgi:hypothetical protein
MPVVSSGATVAVVAVGDSTVAVFEVVCVAATADADVSCEA